ncbi:MAG: YchO/YchP family invasin [Pantoea sp.]|uniref:Adhesin/invasin n=1 Tax=Pantoea brenneri TaxID=472694 RepID=A0AAX3J4Y8_9GAMM|nr:MULTISPECIES: YchO/YchP family invasin [Pantoea]MBS6035126.1 YchO/YchP family invasin [Pantoea sp.]MDH2125115.1 YchO/YchP family invasin [Pantoea brenneri]VXB67293.1 putative adhesin/invasin [Pantoea brenneri]
MIRKTVILSLIAPVLLVTQPVRALQTETRVSETPFDDPARYRQSLEALPTLGSSAEQDEEWSRKLASVAKSIGEASNNDSNASFGQQAGVWAFNHLRDEVANRVESEGQSLLSPYGTAQLDLMVDMNGNFTGTGGDLFSALADENSMLTFSQLGLHDTGDGVVGNAGLGQRWDAGNWLLGYNGFVDRVFSSGLQRASLGTEAWSHNLRLSANYYMPLSGWKNLGDSQQQRMARGYDITSQTYLPFYRQLGVSVSYQQYLGENVDLFNSGNRYHNPSAMSFGLSYTPVPLVTLSATHKTSSAGETQDQLGLKLNYRFGVALRRQLDASNVDEARSLRGSRYDIVTRSDTPVLSFRQRKTLSVFLATPPWQLNAGESLPLKLQVRASNPIKAVSWQGDTQALSLTPPANNADPQGWSVILPQWDDSPGASNEYRLSVTLEDNKQQRVTSNWITLKIQPPMAMDDPSADNRYDLMAPIGTSGVTL